MTAVMKKLTLRGATLRQTDTQGLPASPITYPNLYRFLEDVNTIGVHGFRWDITHPTENPHVEQFVEWDRWLDPNNIGLGLAWDSWPTFCESWKRDRWHTYHRAWDIAGKSAARGFRRVLFVISNQRRKVNIVCHSLGSRVVLKGLESYPSDKFLPISRILILNGAETSDCAHSVVSRFPSVRFYNVGTKNDRVLRYLGGVFTPGRFYEPTIGLHGFPKPLPNTQEWWLDNSRIQRWAEAFGWDLDGSGWFGTAGHHTSMSHVGNWPLYESILNDRVVPDPQLT